MNKKILLVSSSIQFYENFLYETIYALSKNNKILIITNTDNQSYSFDRLYIKNVNISRSINPFKDLKASFKLMLQLKSLKPDFIISSSPKGGLITTLSNFFFRIPRVHILTGILWSDQNSIKLKNITKFIDYINFKFSKKVYIDSKSQIDFLINHNFPKNKISLISKGSIKGVDLNEFKLEKIKKKIKNSKFNLSENTLIILFLGRISPEKGIHTYLSTIREIVDQGYDIRGFIVGRDEKNILKNYRKKNLDFDKYFKYFGYTNKPEFFLKLSDLVLIPSSREGFCQVAIEASSCEVPVIGFDVIGLKDSIKHNVSGYLVPYKDEKGFKKQVKLLIENKSLRLKVGKQGRDFVKNNFNKDDVTDNLIKQIENDLKLFCHDKY